MSHKTCIRIPCNFFCLFVCCYPNSSESHSLRWKQFKRLATSGHHLCQQNLVWRVTLDSRNSDLINGQGQFNYIIVDSLNYRRHLKNRTRFDASNAVSMQCARTKCTRQCVNTIHSEHDLIIKSLNVQSFHTVDIVMNKC